LFNHGRSAAAEGNLITYPDVWKALTVSNHSTCEIPKTLFRLLVGRFAAAEGDLITYLNVWKAWCDAGRERRWAHRYCVNHRNLLRAADIRTQLEYQAKCPSITLYAHAMSSAAGYCKPSTSGITPPCVASQLQYDPQASLAHLFF